MTYEALGPSLGSAYIDRDTVPTTNSNAGSGFEYVLTWKVPAKPTDIHDREELVFQGSPKLRILLPIIQEILD